MKLEHDYTEETFFKNLIECFYHKVIKKRKLLVKIQIKPGTKGEYLRVEKWTDLPASQLAIEGYRPAKGLHDSISWLGTRMFAKIEGGQEFPIAEVYPAKKDTAYTLNDAMLSDADNRFKKALARAALGQSADWQKIILIGAVGIAAVIASKYFGIW